MGSTNRRKSLAQTLVSSLQMKFDQESETTRLEAEIAEDEKPIPQSRLSRFRRNGAMLLHSKHVLMVVVLLNVIDCLLVTGELILDIHFIKELLEESDLESQRFVDQMQARYPDHLSGHDIDHMGVFHNALYRAKCYWDEDPAAICGNTNQIRKLLEVDDTDVSDVDNVEKAHGPWEDVAHGLHKTSIAILGVLFLENIFKIFFMGMGFFHRKIEVFDAFIVCASFILDLVFLKGLIVYPIQDGVLILSFLLPWRVVRVVNSLIVAILDHEHFRLKMMYKEKKKLANGLEAEQHTTSLLKDKLHKIEKFLENEGMPRWKFVHYTHFDEKNTSVSSMASLALKGMMHSFFNTPHSPPQLEPITEDDSTDTGHVNNNTMDDDTIRVPVIMAENKCDPHTVDDSKVDTKQSSGDVVRGQEGARSHFDTQGRRRDSYTGTSGTSHSTTDSRDDALCVKDKSEPHKNDVRVEIDAGKTDGPASDEVLGDTRKPVNGYINAAYTETGQVMKQRTGIKTDDFTVDNELRHDNETDRIHGDSSITESPIHEEGRNHVTTSNAIKSHDATPQDQKGVSVDADQNPDDLTLKTRL